MRFDDNAAVLLNNKREMLGTRIGGVVSADLRMKGWGKIVSLAPKVGNHLQFLGLLMKVSYRLFNMLRLHVSRAFSSILSNSYLLYSST